ncbi:glycosyl hydrolase family 16 [Kineococcus xinjiangensis]|uniref:Glycosyl hydrolase family 16 n=1 Tax=Kineococcus xinjiangensis TaxID=512762 RepID=A0A2S6IT34_9ACTN|nr:NPCBM/NEW2 domain-containing protein [Kineococcus xinjiangensis]PPK97305.1 glycosyl hydrolase family 16 [Kineococcus xinjiangensis]
MFRTRRTTATCSLLTAGLLGWAGAPALATASPQGPAGTVRYVSALDFEEVANGWGPVERDRSNGERGAGDGRQLTVGGKSYARGLGVHPGSEVRVTSPGECTFASTVGLDGEVKGRGSVVFQVFNGEEEVWNSGRITGRGTKAVTAELAAGEVLRLVVTDAGDDPHHDHADWADARLTCRDGAGAQPPPSAPSPAPSAFEPQSFEGFDTTLDDELWWRYGGVASASRSPYASSGVSVSGGNLVLTSRKGADGVWRGAGVGHRVNQTYGRWTVRARAEKGRGITMVALLWPSAGGRPPEIDFAEDNGGDRDMMSVTTHFEDRTRKHSETAIDSTQWHDYAVEWTPGQIKYLIDGKVWATVADTRVPDEDMRLGIQTEAWVKGTNWIHSIEASTPRQVRIFVDSVKVESYVG